jgi:hypothetical protein
MSGSPGLLAAILKAASTLDFNLEAPLIEWSAQYIGTFVDFSSD